MLNINLSTLIFQIVNFLVLAFLLYKFLFKPVMRILDERAERVTQALDEAERREEEARKLKDEYLKKLEDAKREAQALREAARREIQKTRQEVIEKARIEIQAMRARAEKEMERERMEAIRQHQEEIASIVTSMSARMLTELGDGHLQEVFFDAFLDRLAKMEDDPSKYRSTVKEMEVVPVEVISADSLSEVDIERLKEVLSSFLDRPVRLELHVDPSLIGGAVVRFGDHLIDGSLKGQLARLRERFASELGER